MHVLVAVNEGVLSGGPLCALEMVQLLRSRGSEVTVVMRRAGPLVDAFRNVASRVVEQPGGRVVPWLDRARFRGIPVPGWHDRRIGRHIITSVQPDVVVAETVVCAEYAVLGHQMGVPSMLSVHEHPPVLDLWLRVHGGPAVLQGVELVANSRATAGLIADRLDVRTTDITVAHPPVAVHREDASSSPVEVPPLVLGLGRASPVKGVDLFIDVAERIGGEGRDVSFRWLGDGPLLPRLRRRVRESNVPIDLPGSVAGTERHFRDATLVVIPSRRESFSRVAVEALAHGVPVVASDLGGLPEAVGPGGVLVEPTTDALVQAVRELLYDPQRRYELGRAGQDWVRERFGIEAYRKAMTPVLDRLTRRALR